MSETSAWLTNALLSDGRAVDIEVSGGAITGVQPTCHHAGEDDLDVGGRLLLPAFAEPHAHIDKALTSALSAAEPGDLRTAMDRFYATGQAGFLRQEECIERASRALELLIASGVTSVRTHVDVGLGTSFDHLGAVMDAAKRYNRSIRVEIVALMYGPLTGTGGIENRRRLAEAIDRGVDAIGGAPQLEPDRPAAIDLLLNAASSAKLPIDLHLDETLDASILDLRVLAQRVIDRGHEFPVTASHCVSLGVQAIDVQVEVARCVAEAEIAVVVLPQTNLSLQGRAHPVSTPRGLAPISVLREAGVLVAAGGDNVQDAFNPLGRGDPLETASLLVAAGQQSPAVAMEMVSGAARRVMRCDPINFEIGDPADFVALKADSIESAIAFASQDRLVIRAGRVTARTTVSTDLTDR